LTTEVLAGTLSGDDLRRLELLSHEVTRKASGALAQDVVGLRVLGDSARGRSLGEIFGIPE